MIRNGKRPCCVSFILCCSSRAPACLERAHDLSCLQPPFVSQSDDTHECVAQGSSHQELTFSLVVSCTIDRCVWTPNRIGVRTPRNRTSCYRLLPETIIILSSSTRRVFSSSAVFYFFFRSSPFPLFFEHMSVPLEHTWCEDAGIVERSMQSCSPLCLVYSSYNCPHPHD